jgi:hypothetical protein
MTKLARDLRISAKQGTHVPATVVDVFFKKASARLSTTGAIVRNLPVVGGPVDIGEVVMVDYTTPSPTIVAIGKEWLTMDDLNRRLAQLETPEPGGQITLAVDLFVGGVLYQVYPASVQGLGQALLDAASGDTVHYHNAKLTIDPEVPEGVSLVGIDPQNSIIYGTITMNDDTHLSNLRVQLTGDLGGDTIGIDCDDVTTRCIIEDCHVFMVNCGSGNVIGISAQTPEPQVVVRDCIVHVEAEAGTAYAIRGTS